MTRVLISSFIHIRDPSPNSSFLGLVLPILNLVVGSTRHPRQLSLSDACSSRSNLVFLAGFVGRARGNHLCHSRMNVIQPHHSWTPRIRKSDTFIVVAAQPPLSQFYFRSRLDWLRLSRSLFRPIQILISGFLCHSFISDPNPIDSDHSNPCPDWYR